MFDAELADAVFDGHADRAAARLRDKPELAAAVDSDGNTLLMVAIGSSLDYGIHPRAWEVLVSVGVDLNVVNRRGQTALTIALAEECPLEVIRLLLDRGADPNLGSALSVAIAVGSGTEAIRALLEAGADPTLPDLYGMTGTALAEMYPDEELQALFQRFAPGDRPAT